MRVGRKLKVKSKKLISHFIFFLLSGIMLISLFSIAVNLQGESMNPLIQDAYQSTRKIDQWISDAWKKRNIQPSNLSTDEEFFRRVSIDINGQIPNVEDVILFIKDNQPDKRQKKIEELLASELYGENMANIWSRLLIGRDYQRNRVNITDFKKWLKEKFNQNTGYDEFVRLVITAEGSTLENPATYYINRYEANAADLAGNASKLFMSKQIQCAQCHNHPYEPISQEDFWAMAAFFSRTKIAPIRDEKRVIGAEIYDRSRGDVYIPDSEPRKKVEPQFLTGEKIDSSFLTKRRVEFANLLTSKENPYFAKAIVNRVWNHYMGHGLIEPIDDFMNLNNASHPEVLDYLAQDFIRHNYDMKYLIRTITNTKTYQLSSRTNESNQKDEKYYSHATLRPLSAEQLFYSLMQSTGMTEARRNINPQQLERLKEGYLRRFVFIFDNDEMEEDESFQGTIPQALMLLNGQLVNDGLKARPGTTMASVIREAPSDSEKIDWLYLAALSRYPTTAEKSSCMNYIKSYESQRTELDENRYAGDSPTIQLAQQRQIQRNRLQQLQQRRNENQQRRPLGFGSNPVYEDIFWALLNSPEFLFNH